jgi:hypothetical protein
MIDSSNTDEQISSKPKLINVSLVQNMCLIVIDRPLRRTSRLSVLKPKSIIDNKIEDVPIVAETFDEVDIEDPPEIYQLGDILWHRVPGNPWWPALIHGSRQIFMSVTGNLLSSSVFFSSGCYYEDDLHTKVVKMPRRGKRRMCRYKYE